MLQVPTNDPTLILANRTIFLTVKFVTANDCHILQTQNYMQNHPKSNILDAVADYSRKAF